MSEVRIRRVRAGSQAPVSVVVRIGARVIRGDVTETDLIRWVEQAIAGHHRFRGGHVTGDGFSLMTAPDVQATDTP